MDNQYLTLGVAAITAAAGILGSLVGGFVQMRGSLQSAREQAKSVKGANASQRFATWQMHKREVYCRLLDSVYVFAASGDTQATSELQGAINRALMVAHKDLRLRLLEISGNAAIIKDSAYRTDLVNHLVEDVHREGRNT